MGLFPVTCTEREEPEFKKLILESVFTQDTAYTVNNQYGYWLFTIPFSYSVFLKTFFLMLTNVIHACINLQQYRKILYRKVELSIVRY